METFFFIYVYYFFSTFMPRALTAVYKHLLRLLTRKYHVKTDYCPAYEEGEEEGIPPCEGRELEPEVTRFMVSRHGHYPPCIHTDCSSRYPLVIKLLY